MMIWRVLVYERSHVMCNVYISYSMGQILVEHRFKNKCWKTCW